MQKVHPHRRSPDVSRKGALSVLKKQRLEGPLGTTSMKGKTSREK